MLLFSICLFQQLKHIMLHPLALLLPRSGLRLRGCMPMAKPALLPFGAALYGEEEDARIASSMIFGSSIQLGRSQLVT